MTSSRAGFFPFYSNNYFGCARFVIPARNKKALWKEGPRLRRGLGKGDLFYTIGNILKATTLSGNNALLSGQF